jgi:hypothetical protein
MDETLIRQIQRNLVGLKHALKEHREIAEAIGITPDIAAKLVRIIHGSGTLGFIEVKEQQISRVMSILDDGKYQSLSNDQLKAMRESITMVLLVTILARKLYSGEKPQTGSGKKAQQKENFDIKTLVTMTTSLIKEHPSLKNEQGYKSITRILNQYNAELSKIKQMVTNIKPENRNNFLTNANKQLAEFTASMNRQFVQLQEAARLLGGGGNNDDTLLDRISESKKIIALCTRQIEQYIKLTSSLDFIMKERYQFQVLVETLVNMKDELLGAIHQEEQAIFSTLADKGIDSGKYTILVEQISDLIVAYLEKHYT